MLLIASRIGSDEFLVYLGDDEINSIMNENVIKKFDSNANLFIEFLALNPLDSIPYANIGDNITINFPDNVEKITVYENLITTDGKFKYTNKETNEITFSVVNNTYTFDVETNYASALSSEMHEFDFRGYRVYLTVNGEDILYTFVIKTDSLVKK